MPAIKPNPKSDDDLDRILWGAKAIGVEVNRAERSVYYMLDKGLIDGTKVGNIWTSTPRRVRRSLGIKS